MGKGDKRTAQGKRYRGTHGKTRPKKTKRGNKSAKKK
jgi:ribosomal small subunit protein bTHX